MDLLLGDILDADSHLSNEFIVDTCNGCHVIQYTRYQRNKRPKSSSYPEFISQSNKRLLYLYLSSACRSLVNQFSFFQSIVEVFLLSLQKNPQIETLIEQRKKIESKLLLLSPPAPAVVEEQYCVEWYKTIISFIESSLDSDEKRGEQFSWL